MWMMAAKYCQHFLLYHRTHRCRGRSLTLDGGLLAKVLGLVPAEETLGLDLRGGATRKLLVERNNTLHAHSVLSGADSLQSFTR
jgi:hypothetical protein